MPWGARKPSREKLGKLQGLAQRKGYTVQRSRMSNHFNLVDAAGEKLRHPETEATAFTADSALWVLRRQPDAAS